MNPRKRSILNFRNKSENKTKSIRLFKPIVLTGYYKNSINTGGKICFEVGINQSEKVKELLVEAKLCEVGSKEDYGGIQRVVFGTVD